MENPTTRRPSRASRQAATELSTPPLMATAVGISTVLFTSVTVPAAPAGVK